MWTLHMDVRYRLEDTPPSSALRVLRVLYAT